MVLRRRQIEPADLGGLGGKIGIIAFAPRLARQKIDLGSAQEAPDILHIDVTQCRRDQGTSPPRVPRRNRPIQHGQDALIRLGRVFRFRSAMAGLIKAGPSIGGVAHAPFRCRAGRAANLSANRAAGHALGRHQHNPRPLAQPLFGLGGTRQRFQLGSFRFRQYDRGRFRNAMHASLNHDSPFRNSRY